MENRKVLITGSNGHVGRETAKLLAEKGFELHGLDLGENLNLNIPIDRFYKCDLANVDEIFHILPQLSEEKYFGYVHLAGMTGAKDDEGWSGNFSEQTLEIWQRTFAVNVQSAFLICQSIFGRRKLDALESGSIVLVSSIYGGHAPDPSLYGNNKWNNPAAYGASKAALESLSRYLSVALGPKIRSNSIVLGGLQRQQSEEFMVAYNRKTVLGRMGHESDVAHAIQYLLAKESAYITGSRLTIDGGFSVL